MIVALAEYLDTLGVGTFDSTGITGDIFINTMPNSPDTAIALFSNGGLPPNHKLGYDDPIIQIRARASIDPRPAYNTLINIYNALHGLSHVTLSDGTLVISCYFLQSNPNYIGKDSNERHEYTLNCIFSIRNTLGNRE